MCPPTQAHPQCTHINSLRTVGQYNSNDIALLLSLAAGIYEISYVYLTFVTRNKQQLKV